MNKDLKKIVKALEAQGFEVRVTKKQHVAVYRNGRIVALFAGSPSDWRSMKNSIRDAQRAGFRWPP